MQKDERHPLSDAMRARVLLELERIERERNLTGGLPRTHADSQQLDPYLRDTVKRFA
ncbi:hypothetical protein [Pseudomonas pergaminensis]